MKNDPGKVWNEVGELNAMKTKSTAINIATPTGVLIGTEAAAALNECFVSSVQYPNKEEHMTAPIVNSTSLSNSILLTPVMTAEVTQLHLKVKNNVSACHDDVKPAPINILQILSHPF